MDSFPFTKLAAELCFEIIRVAAEPEWDNDGPYYLTAVALCSVSHAVRQGAIRFLLNTVFLCSPTQLLAFVDAIHIQHIHQQTNSCLQVDYTRFVRRLLFRDCWEPLPEQSREAPVLDYSALYGVMRNAENLGIDFNSLHILYRGLASAGACPITDWNCRKVVFSGEYYRWSPLVVTVEGSAFLSRITHLVLWIPPNDCGLDAYRGTRIPDWIRHVPFSSLSNLTHVAFPLIPLPTDLNSQTEMEMSMLVYSASDASSKFDPNTFYQWALSDHPSTKGTVVNGFTMNFDRLNGGWDCGHLQEDSGTIWAKAAQVRGE
jgi:hypothetical protein